MPFPFLYLAAALASGILLSSLLSVPFSISISGLASLLTLAWLAFILKKNKPAFALCLSAAVFLGFGLYSRENKNYERNPVKAFDFNGYADFYGWLYRSPSCGVGRTYLFIKVEKIGYLNKEEKASGNLRVSVLHPAGYPSPVKLKVGDRIKVSAQVLPARDFRNFGEPRLANLRKNQKIHNHAVTKSPLLLEVQKKKRPFSVFRLISAVRQRFVEKIEAHFSSADRTELSREGAVLEALLLGERGRMDEATTLALQKSGLFHLVAISGAHIAIISYFLFGILRLFRTPKRYSYVILFFLLLFYALLVEARASVFRAVVMSHVYLVGKLLWKNTRLLNAISFSAFFLLLVNPFYLFDLGFELTFAAALSIILFFPRVLRFLPRLPLKISELFALSLTAQAGVLPFLASSFNRVAFSSLLLNFAAVPLTGLIMALGFVFLGSSLLSHSFAQILALALKFLVDILVLTSHLFDPVPGFSYRIPTPPLPVILGYFLSLSLLLLRPKLKGQKSLTFAVFGIFLALLISYPFPARFSRTLKLTFLDVGQGDSILVEFPGRKKMLVDGGGVPDDSFDIGENVVSPFLWRKGIKKIDYLVLTHAHPDHMNGLKAVARNFKISQYWEVFSPPQSASYEELRSNLQPSVIKKRIFRGFRQQEGAVRIEAVHPPEERPYVLEASNDKSLVLRVSLGETAFLLAADIELGAEREICEKNSAIPSQVLKSPHHGSKSSSSQEFLDLVRPRIVVVSVGRGNLFGVPNQEILERYEHIGARVLRTDEDGAVEIAASGEGITVRTSRRDSTKIAVSMASLPETLDH
jgi:competence protein ComEC